MLGPWSKSVRALGGGSAALGGRIHLTSAQVRAVAVVLLCRRRSLVSKVPERFTAPPLPLRLVLQGLQRTNEPGSGVGAQLRPLHQLQLRQLRLLEPSSFLPH